MRMVIVAGAVAALIGCGGEGGGGDGGDEWNIRSDLRGKIYIYDTVDETGDDGPGVIGRTAISYDAETQLVVGLLDHSVDLPNATFVAEPKPGASRGANVVLYALDTDGNGSFSDSELAGYEVSAVVNELLFIDETGGDFSARFDACAYTAVGCLGPLEYHYTGALIGVEDRDAARMRTALDAARRFAAGKGDRR